MLLDIDHIYKLINIWFHFNLKQATFQGTYYHYVSFIGLDVYSLYKIQLTTPKYPRTEREHADTEKCRRQCLCNLDTKCKRLNRECVSECFWRIKNFLEYKLCNR